MNKQLQIILNILTRKQGPDAAAELQKVADVAKKAGEDTTLLEQAQKSLADTTKNTAEATDKLVVKNTDLKGIVQALAREFPALGLIGRAALNPVVGVFIALTFAVSKARQEYAEFKAILERTADLTGLKGAITGVNTALSETKTTARELMEVINKSSSGIKGRADEAIESLKQQSQKIRELMEAEKELTEARLKADLETGKITPEQFATKSAAIASAFARADRERLNKLDADTLQTLERNQAKSAGRREEMRLKAPGLIQNAELAEAEAARIKENLPTARENLRKQAALIGGDGKDDVGLQGELNKLALRLAPGEDELLSRFGSLPEFIKWASTQPSKTPYQTDTAVAHMYVELNAKLVEERRKQERIASSVRDLDAREEPAAQRARALRDAAEKNSTELKDADAEYDSVTERLKRARKDIPAAQEHRARLGSIEDQTRIVESGVLSAPAPRRVPTPYERQFQNNPLTGGINPLVPAPPVNEVKAVGEAFKGYDAANKSALRRLEQDIKALEKELGYVSSRVQQRNN